MSLGYAIVKDEPGIIYRAQDTFRNILPSFVDGDFNSMTIDGNTLLGLYTGFMSGYKVIDSRGYYLNAEVNYKFRSLIEASAAVKYAPHDNEMFDSDKHYNNYKLGVDRASTVASIDLKVTPWRPLTVNAGLEYRGGRMALFHYDIIDGGEYLRTAYNFVTSFSYRRKLFICHCFRSD